MRLASTLTLLCALGSAACGQTQTEIQAQYDRFAKAYVRNDVVAMLDILSPDYRLVDGNGKVISYKSYRKQLEDKKKSGKTGQRYTVQIVKIETAGRDATVRTQEVSVGRDGKKDVHLYRDSWRRSGKRWLLSATKTLGHG